MGGTLLSFAPLAVTGSALPLHASAWRLGTAMTIRPLVLSPCTGGRRAQECFQDRSSVVSP
jgi:hypothetical protein